jgi:hypothetical protein
MWPNDSAGIPTLDSFGKPPNVSSVQRQFGRELPGSALVFYGTTCRPRRGPLSLMLRGLTWQQHGPKATVELQISADPVFHVEIPSPGVPLLRSPG